MLDQGQILQDRYQLQRPLGRLGVGRQTWLASDSQVNELVVLKLLAFSPQMQWEELKLFEREAQVLQTLKHPRIPCYRDYFSLEQEAGGGLPWFVLVQDFIPGPTLQELLDQHRRFNEAEIRQIAQSILEILSYLHELTPPFLHRDIKPSNLILNGNSQVYLIDFGAVQDKAAATGLTFTVVGTCGYAPLEQFWGRAVPASDLYALGATLVHLLTGIAPADLLQDRPRLEFASRVTISSPLLEWLEKLTEPAVENRWQTAKEALRTLKLGIEPASQKHTFKVSKISKPQNSTIDLHQSAKKLNIQFSGFVNLFGDWDLRGFGCLVLWIFWTYALIFAIFQAIFSKFVRIQVNFDRNCFEIKHQLFN